MPFRNVKGAMLVFVLVWFVCAHYAWKRIMNEKTTKLRKRTTPSKPTDAIYVLTLQGVEGADEHNKHRLDEFMNHINTLDCTNGMNINVCPGIYKPHLQPGFGTTEAYIHCLDKIYKDGVQRAYIFEDDIRFFDRETCLEIKPKLQASPQNTFLLLYGGHHWEYDMQTSQGKYNAVKKAWGAYGWGIRRESIQPIKDGFYQELNSGTDIVSPEKSWQRTAIAQKKVIYATIPLLLEHPASWSNTWHGSRPKIDENTLVDESN